MDFTLISRKGMLHSYLGQREIPTENVGKGKSVTRDVGSVTTDLRDYPTK